MITKTYADMSKQEVISYCKKILEGMAIAHDADTIVEPSAVDSWTDDELEYFLVNYSNSYLGFNTL